MHPTILLQLADLRTDERLRTAATRRLTRRSSLATRRPAEVVVGTSRLIPVRSVTRPVTCAPHGC